KAIEYEEYLKRIANVARQVKAGQAEDAPELLRSSPALRALYNNLVVALPPESTHEIREGPGPFPEPDRKLKLAVDIDEAIKRVRPDSWRGMQAKEQIIKGALFDVLKDANEVERIFLIIKQQAEY
ncbi:MAG: restriction endonuclease subunit R, partial [Dokdonella sp.]